MLLFYPSPLSPSFSPPLPSLPILLPSPRPSHLPSPFSLLPSLSSIPQLTMQHNDGSTRRIFDPVYFPLDPGDCMCSTMEEAAENLHNLTAFSCNITDEECTNIYCVISDTNPQSYVDTRISPCDNPPSLHTTVVIYGNTQTIDANGNKTTRLNVLPADLKITIWHFDYSMDVEVSIHVYTVHCTLH